MFGCTKHFHLFLVQWWSRKSCVSPTELWCIFSTRNSCICLCLEIKMPYYQLLNMSTIKRGPRILCATPMDSSLGLGPRFNGQLSRLTTTVCTRRLRVWNCATTLGPQRVYLVQTGPEGISPAYRVGTPSIVKKIYKHVVFCAPYISCDNLQHSHTSIVKRIANFYTTFSVIGNILFSFLLLQINVLPLKLMSHTNVGKPT